MEAFLLNFWFLLFAHFIADFSLQSDFMSKYKYKLPYVMFIHCFIWLTCLIIMSVVLNLYPPGWFWAVTYFIHFATDWTKCHLIEKQGDQITEETLKTYFNIDQAIHVVQVAFLALF